MSEPEREHMDYKLLKTLRRGDETVVRTFFSDIPEDSVIGERRRSWRGVTAGGNSALHIVAGCGHLELAKFICDGDSSHLAAQNEAEETPLHCAARAGADRIVRLFITVAMRSHRQEELLLLLLLARDREGKTALYAAAERGRAAAARELMSALPKLATVVDNKGVSPLYVAVLSGSLQVVQILIGSRQEEASYAGPNGESALHAAAKINSPEITKILLQWKSTLAKEADSSGSTLLHYLATTPKSFMVCELLKHDSSLAYKKDSNGLYPIHVASIQGRSDVVRELLKHCPDMDELVDNRGRNFLHIAIEHNRTEIVNFVCQSTLLMKMMNEKDYDENTPLHLAAASSKRSILNLLLENRSVHRMIMDRDGQTPLEIWLRRHSTSKKEEKKMAMLKTVGYSEFFRGVWHHTREYERDDRNMFECEMERINRNAASITEEEGEEEEEEEEEDQTMFGREWKRRGDKLFDALTRGDESYVRSLFFPGTEAQDSLAIDVRGADIVADQAWRSSRAGSSSLLAARNAALETPLHCAARTGAGQLVSLFISVARRWEEGRRLEEVLRATDREGKTALHAAAKEGHAAVVSVLASADAGLAAIVDDYGVSPLYAAVLSKSLGVVQILIELESTAVGGEQVGTSAGRVTPKASYAGPKGQTALHAAAVVESPEILDKLMQWKPKLTKKIDNSRVSPLHYLATTSNTTMVCQLLDYDDSLAYLSDSKGFYPIHFAAGMGRCAIIHKLIDRCHDMDKLVDNRGMNFLHFAVQENRPMVVKYVCRQRGLAKMMNARDDGGNTPLHLAVYSQNQEIVRLLLENGSVHPSIKNKNGQTPLDLAIDRINYGLKSIQNPNIWIFHCLQQIGAICDPQRLNHLIHDPVNENLVMRYREEELQKYNSTAQNLAIVSVLIATVTFAAAFTMPGGSIADDHQNGGTPTLARKYAFTAFIVSDFVAFLCSIVATTWLMFAGSLAIHPSRRLKLILRSEAFIDVAAQSMMAAFALSVYVVLAPVNVLIAIAVCIFAFPSVLLSNPELWQHFRLTMTLKRRLGWSGLCKARLIGRPLGYATESFNWFIFRPIVCYLLVYIFIFGISLILSIKYLHFT